MKHLLTKKMKKSELIIEEQILEEVIQDINDDYFEVREDVVSAEDDGSKLVDNKYITNFNDNEEKAGEKEADGHESDGQDTDRHEVDTGQDTESDEQQTDGYEVDGNEVYGHQAGGHEGDRHQADGHKSDGQETDRHEVDGHEAGGKETEGHERHSTERLITEANKLVKKSIDNKTIEIMGDIDDYFPGITTSSPQTWRNHFRILVPPKDVWKKEINLAIS